MGPPTRLVAPKTLGKVLVKILFHHAFAHFDGKIFAVERIVEILKSEFVAHDQITTVFVLGLGHGLQVLVECNFKSLLCRLKISLVLL